jgi:hypothetical protein
MMRVFNYLVISNYFIIFSIEFSCCMRWQSIIGWFRLCGHIPFLASYIKYTSLHKRGKVEKIKLTIPTLVPSVFSFFSFALELYNLWNY